VGFVCTSSGCRATGTIQTVIVVGQFSQHLATRQAQACVWLPGPFSSTTVQSGLDAVTRSKEAESTIEAVARPCQDTQNNRYLVGR
jgi:hypothetical protein